MAQSNAFTPRAFDTGAPVSHLRLLIMASVAAVCKPSELKIAKNQHFRKFHCIPLQTVHAHDQNSVFVRQSIPFRLPMPTELPNLTLQFLRSYNEQQRILASVRDGDLSELKQQLREAEELLAKREDAQQEMQAQLVRYQEQLRVVDGALRQKVEVLEKELEGCRESRREAEVKRAREVPIHQKKLDEANSARAEQSERIRILTLEIDSLNERLADGPKGRSPLPATVQTLNDIRKKITAYSRHLTELREFELKISPKLTRDQLQKLIGSLETEMLGMIERYQTLSLWEADGQTGK